MTPSTPPTTHCKCCGSPSTLCGLLDLSKGGADIFAGKKIEPYAGIPIYYYACEHCGFTFTTAMDEWSATDFSRMIYNDDYIKHDPDYAEKRPLGNAGLVENSFTSLLSSSVLDYGSGSGLLEKTLRARGHQQIDSYDPYSHNTPPSQKYQTVLAFEVFEHHPQPVELFTKLDALLEKNGAVLFSTVLITPEIHKQGLANWWYCMPRNGHISFYTKQSLALLAKQFSMRAGSFSNSLHFLYKRYAPDWASQLSYDAL